jgi:hypothetical protein
MRTSGLALRSDKIEPTLQDARGLELGEGAAHIALAGRAQAPTLATI